MLNHSRKVYNLTSMLTVDSLSKNYNRHEILKDLSFSATKGEIIGILGTNGAGKSTLLRILSGYLPATSGSITFNKLDLFKNSLEIQARLGYLPENTPLYPEMRVEEYIRYRAALKRVPKRRMKEKVVDVLDLCGIHSISNRLIGTLSKGFRQRVGLADALVNEPDLLILDEPTLGLDPTQQSQIGSLIRGLSKHHTVLFSTHLIKEIEMIATRAMILHQGNIIAMGTPEELSPLEETFTRFTQREEL